MNALLSKGGGIGTTPTASWSRHIGIALTALTLRLAGCNGSSATHDEGTDAGRKVGDEVPTAIDLSPQIDAVNNE
jgi:hypothetical protein